MEPLFFRKIQVSKNVRDKRGREEGGYHDLPSKLLSHSTKTFRRETLVSESFRYRKILCIRGGYHDFLSEFCCLTVPKYFIDEPSVFQKVSGTEKVYP